MINYKGPGFNNSSPIVNNMMPMHQQPPMYNPNMNNPNMMPIGGVGYNMPGYYNQGMGYGYYNPYVLEEQRKAQEARLREEQRNQSGILKKLSRMANHSTGLIPDNMMDNHLGQYDIKEQTYDEEYYKMERVVRLAKSIENAVDVTTMPHERIIASNRMFEEAMREIPEDISLNRYLHKCGELLYNIEQEELKKRNNDATKLYNGDEYSQLIKLHKSMGTGYFEDTFKQSYTNLDDMEIKLPSEIKDKYEDRRKKFFSAIFEGNQQRGVV